MPLNGRNVLDLALLQPGVVPAGGGFGAGSGIRVNGSRGTENNVTLDGASNNEVAVGGLIGGITRPDAVQEFRLLTSNFEAEFGRVWLNFLHVDRVSWFPRVRWHVDVAVHHRPIDEGPLHHRASLRL